MLQVNNFKFSRMFSKLKKVVLMRLSFLLTPKSHSTKLLCVLYFQLELVGYADSTPKLKFYLKGYYYCYYFLHYSLYFGIF